MEMTYKIEFNSYWHIGSGLSGGTDVDALVLKDTNGFPYIPGKTLKGLIREAAETLESLESEGFDKNWINELFGIRTEDLKKDENSKNELSGKRTDEAENSKKEKEYDRQHNKLFFTNATLTSTLQESIISEKTQQYLFEKIASTTIDKDTGITKKHSLREMQVVVPLTLFAKIYNVPEAPKEESQNTNGKSENSKYIPDNSDKKLEKCLKMVKRMGVNRNRGLGRCQLSIVEQNQKEENHGN
jgi:CRISPR/Cas system CSM-associated protein Csm3 (group 7 of RAMP superfamily)